ncbi:MAG TPA: helix-turn-helix transcriptional regulator [Mucilaginibacter sp.]|nr:helix-turn-helix transcriptional regulator [Mucilaginibacter sp.]
MLELREGNFMGEVTAFKAHDGLVSTVSYYPQERPYTEPVHYHETLHLSMVLAGGNLEKRKAKEIDCLPGKVTCYDAGELHHSLQIVPGSRQVNLEITAGFMKANDLLIGAASIETCDAANIRFLMLQVYRESILNDAESALNIASILAGLLSYKAKNEKGIPHWVPKIKEALYDRWDESLSLTELALIAGLHPANLSGYFPKYFGCTIGQYRRKLKIEKALELVKFSADSLSTIAQRTGFADQSHFTRTCKELTGWSPGQIKAMGFKFPQH